MQADKIRSPKQLVPLRHLLYSFRKGFEKRIVADHLHIQAERGLPGDQAPDLADPCHAESLALEVHTDDLVPNFEVAGPKLPLAQAEISRSGDDQPQGVLRHGTGVALRTVRHVNSQLLGPLHIDVVYTDAVSGYDPELFRCLQHFGRVGCRSCENGVAFRSFSLDYVHAYSGSHDDLAVSLPEIVLSLVCDVLRYEYFVNHPGILLSLRIFRVSIPSL